MNKDANDIARELGAGGLRDVWDQSTDAPTTADESAVSLTVDADVEILSSGDFVRGFVPPDYLVDGILQRRYIYSFTGLTGAGKTAIALHLAYCVALAKSFGGVVVEKGRVLFCAGENPDDICMRWIAMSFALGFDPDLMDVYFIAGNKKFSKTEASIRRKVKALGGVDLVVVDTSIAFFEEEEESHNVQALRHAHRLRHLTTLPGGPTVFVTCHPTKKAQADDLIPRGGGAFLNEMDGNLTCALKGELLTEVHWQGKVRGPDFAPMTFKLLPIKTERLVDSKGRPIPSIVAISISEAEQAAAERGTKSAEDALLVAMLEKRDGSLADLAKAASITLRSGLPDKKKVSRLLLKLCADKLTRKTRDNWRLTKEGKIEAERVKIATTGTFAEAVK